MTDKLKIWYHQFVKADTGARFIRCMSGKDYLRNMKSLLQKFLGVSAAALAGISCLFPVFAVSAAWVHTGTVWSYTDSGRLMTGWQKINGVWYYFNGSGVMQTGWQKINGSWYYLGSASSGAMQTGWKKIDGAWYLFNGGGVMKTGWVQSGGYWYFLNGGGVMKTGWVYSGGKWYYMDADGRMQTGWLLLGNTRYYLNENGEMATGALSIGGVIYTFSSSGALIGAQENTSGDYAGEVLSQINTARRKEGLSSLSLSDSLCKVALARAKEQAQMGRISHQRPDGTEWYTILTEYGLSAAGCGENLAVNYTSASSVVKAWLESSAHKSNIMNTQYVSMGIGYYEMGGNIYWVQLFSANA